MGQEEKRHMLLTQHDLEALAGLIRDRPPVSTCEEKCIHKDDPKHAAEHAVLERWIANDIRRAERWEKMRSSFIVGAALMLLSALGTGAYHAAEYIREHLK